MSLQLRQYQCNDCGRLSMHTTNHTGSIYPECRNTNDQQEHSYLEDVRVVELDTTKPLIHQFKADDWIKVVHGIGRMIKSDHGRRVYITSKGAQVESNEQMKKRKGIAV